MEQQEDNKPAYEVKPLGKGWGVWNSKDNVLLTVEIPDKEIAEEIKDDFEKMEKRDFTPIGLPDFSRKEE